MSDLDSDRISLLLYQDAKSYYDLLKAAGLSWKKSQKRLLRQSLVQSQATIPNQLGKPTSSPTLRWVFQSFQAIHLVWVDGNMQISNLTDTRLKILRFMGAACQKYYLLC